MNTTETPCRCTSTDRGDDRSDCPRHGNPCPPDLLAALEYGELTRDQLRRFIAWEASQFGMTFDQAVKAAEVGALPKTALGSDVDLLLRMWEDFR